MKKLKVVEFQTVSYCNSDCLVCPWSQLKKSAVLKYMNDDTWNSLLQGLEEMQPDRVIPYLNNEPLLDKDIFAKIETIKKIVPHCSIELSTNGALMNEDIAKKISLSSIDDILISVFGHDEESQRQIMGNNVPYKIVKENILRLKNILEKNNIKKNLAVVKIVNSPYVSYDNIMKNKIFWNSNNIEVYEYGYLDRAKNVGNDNQRDINIKPNGCELNRHNERMYIYFDGEVSLCCHDWRKRFLLGNINNQSLKEIWDSQLYKKYRMMVDGDINSGKNFLCRSCKLCLEEGK